MKKQNQVGDYLFSDENMAVLATKEAEKIAKLEEKLGETNIIVLYKLYNKCIEKKSFSTPVGYDFMKKIKKILEEDENTPGEVLPIPLNYPLDLPTKNADVKNNDKRKTEKTDDKYILKNPYFIWSIFANVILVLLVFTMFWIATTGDSPNVINHENAVLNKYAQWEQELTQWEQELTERENALREAGY